MPVFTQICSADPVPTTTATCTCPGVDVAHMDEMTSLVVGPNSCALHSSVALLKQQASAKQQQLLKKHRPDPFASVRMLPSQTFHLFPGSRFQGKQKSGENSYDVMVDIKHVNLDDSTLCGYLHIKGLTEEYPELTTFFDAEIIGPKYSFLTQKWNADDSVDKDHWERFGPYEPNIEEYRKSATPYDFRNRNMIFMRWKEHFLVPDHRVEGITGASFAGFYYICYNKLSGTINGYYWHQLSEKYQNLLLSHVPNQNSFSTYEFR